MAEGEPEPHRDRAFAVGHQLAGGVVDGRDMVGVEGVSQAQGVGGDAEPDAEHLRAHRVVPGNHDQQQRSPCDDVQQCDHAEDSGDPPPVTSTPSDG
jgi:hypothetical protein